VLLFVYAVVGDSLSSSSPARRRRRDVIRRADAERFIEDVRGDEPELAS
jgi:hypothetical protein